MKYFTLIILFTTLISCTSESPAKKDTGEIKKGETVESEISTKRSAPREVKAIIHDGMEYHVALNELIVIDSASRDTAWRKIVYDIVYDLDLEKDIQDVFIDSMVLMNNSLLVRNEDGAFFMINIKDQSVFPNPDKSQEVNKSNYSLIIDDLTSFEFDQSPWGDTSSLLLDEKQCLAADKIRSTSPNEYQLLLNSGQYYKLKKAQADEQFFGYQFIHYDSLRKIYVFWENWLEAGHPVMISAVNGELTEIYGKNFSHNGDKNLCVNFAEDIGAGWTPNGILLLKKTSNSFKKLFDFDPSIDLNDTWGPVEVKWKNDNTLLIHAIENDAKGGYNHLYKKLQFSKK
jgi:hypothetical protein